MIRLPHSRRPYPGELFQGYIMSLAVMNDNMALDEFEHIFLYGKRRLRRSGFGYPESLSHICRRMRDDPFFPDVEEAIAMTPYYYEAAKLSEKEQARLAESILYDINEEMTPNRVNKNAGGLRYCPKCQEEDKEKYGTWYFHLEHNLPGACKCEKHHRPLIELERFDKRHTNFPDMTAGKLMSFEVQEEKVGKIPELISVKCPDCGEIYLTHPYSHSTGAGCPFCRHNMGVQGFLQHRLDIVHPNEYTFQNTSNGLQTRCLHIPCGKATKSVDTLLYKEKSDCTGCINWTVHKVQQEIDPLKEHFVVKRSYRSKADATMITVKHVDCGRTFDISKPYFRNDPHCPECRREEAAKPYADLGISGYSIVSTYYNNRDMITICHEECGCVFQSSKTSMIAGKRCPICTNHYDLEAVVAAVESCCPGYIVVKGKKRGDADIYKGETCIYQGLPYYKIMNDLQEDEPALLTGRVKRYVPPKSIRRRIYDAVKAGVDEKGYWTAAGDGFEGRTITREERNILQDLANLGYVKRLKKGVYTIEQIQVSNMVSDISR